MREERLDLSERGRGWVRVKEARGSGMGERVRDWV